MYSTCTGERVKQNIGKRRILDEASVETQG